MTERKWTPGPWKVGNRYTDTSVFSMDDDLVANTHGSQRNYRRDEQLSAQDANAHLIAAAPCLYEGHAENVRLLSLLLHDLTGRVEAGKLAAIETAIRRSETVMAKAEGRS